MTELRLWITLIRHTALLWRTGLLRFRLETFGTYYPHPPYEAPAWRLSLPHTFTLLRRARAYGRWLMEMEALQRSGPRGWWQQRGVNWDELQHD